jgi:hypothetical protein
MPPRKKQSSKRINIDSRARWKTLLKTVSHEEVPVTMIKTVTVNLIDGTQVTVDIDELLSEGHSSDDIETMLNTRLKKLDEIIKNVDIFINVDSVAKTVQPVTDTILKNF